MKNNINFLNILKNYIKKYLNKKEAEKSEKKKRVIDTIESTFTEEQIKDYNLNLIADSAGWLGGNYTERDLKISLLKDYDYLFTEEEYDELHDKILLQEEMENRIKSKGNI